MRFTWTYGTDNKSTIFINDNTLPNPKERGIAAITCHSIGNDEAERLAMAFCAAPHLLYACKEMLKEMRAYIPEDEHDGEAPNKPLFDMLKAAITEAEGRVDSDAEIYDAETCPHGYGFVEHCPDCKDIN